VNGKVIDWAQYSDADITRFLGELTTEREKRKVGKRKELKERIRSLLKEEGLSVEDVFPTVGKGRGRPPMGKPVAAERPVKYRNPADASQTWTGMGRKPGWLVEALASGKKLEEFAA
jgi:DNA-binding protein H-NS